MASVWRRATQTGSSPSTGSPCFFTSGPSPVLSSPSSSSRPCSCKRSRAAARSGGCSAGPTASRGAPPSSFSAPPYCFCSTGRVRRSTTRRRRAVGATRTHKGNRYLPFHKYNVLISLILLVAV
ncbi:hypothetical protein NP493_318g01029 [Ridgeia piscesae]|uniref:Uncharacterized protein n=1 Tax=Ridgeia piscesae TaxID=27915 RepID=A0AAD9NUR3_RIDPI|nr:hypothetical protein NP493_318g01029 [Ridgeia piscesae]